MRVGRSTATPFKQENLKTLFDIQLYKTKCVFEKHKEHEWCDQTYHLFDITAGDADPQNPTSPSIFINGLYSAIELEFQATFVEKTKKTFNKLKTNIHRHIDSFECNIEKPYFLDNKNIKIINGSSEQILEKYCKEEHKWEYGLLYYDANGFQQDLWDLVVEFSKTWNVLDIAINFSPVQLKRNLNVKKIKGFNKYNKNLKQTIAQIKKQNIYVRNSIVTNKNNFKHIMLFCTNFGDYKRLEKEHNFVHIESQEGKNIINSFL